MIGIAFSSWSSWVFGTVIGAFSGSGLLQGYPAVEAALGFMLPALFMSFLLASFQRKQSLCVTAALVGALAGVTLFSIPVAHSGRHCLWLPHCVNPGILARSAR